MDDVPKYRSRRHSKKPTKANLRNQIAMLEKRRRPFAGSKPTYASGWLWKYYTKKIDELTEMMRAS